MDSGYEIRSMILASLPYPPLPVEVKTVEPGTMVLGTESVTTSHALLAQCLQIAAARGDDKANEERKLRQVDVFRRFLHAMAVEGFEMSGGELYGLYCDYTRQHLETYFHDGQRFELAFKPLSYIAKGDACHTRMCEFMAAQSILFRDPVPLKASHYNGKTYACMLELARDRIGHTMTEEEREETDRREAAESAE